MFQRYACVLQQDQSDCAPAVLATVARHYGLETSIARLRDLIGTDRVGSNLLGVARAAEQMGFSAKGAKGDWDGLKTVPLPCIAHVVTKEGYGHFVVVHKLGDDTAIVADPGRGVEKQKREEFCQRWTGYVLILVPGELRPEAPSPSKMSLIGALVAPHRGILLRAFLCAILFTMLGLSTSLFIEHLIDSILVHGRTKLLNVASVGMLVLLVFRALFGYVRSYFLMDVSCKVDLTLVSYYMRHVVRLPMRFFETRQVGEILSRVNDAVKIREAISSTVLTTLVDGTMVVAAAIAMLVTDLKLGLVCLAFVPIFVLAILALRRPIAKRQRQAMERGAEAEAQLVEDVSGAETIKVFAVEAQRSQQVDSKLVQLVKSFYSVGRLGLGLSTVTLLAGGAGTIVALWYGGHRVIEGALTIGQLMFFYSLVGTMFGPLERLGDVAVSLQDASIALDRLWEVLRLELEDKRTAAPAALEPLREGIRFEKVTFAYGQGRDVFRDLELVIPAGKMVAIVGESGSGKSTVCRLLARLYAPVQGRITVDGMDLRDLPLDGWRRKVGYVPQDPHVFSGSVADNISFGRAKTTLEEIVGAARAAGIDEFISQLPERYNTKIGERGMNLSGGQRQRLAIARAVLWNPEILLLDEATSHLDAKTERIVQVGIRSQMAERTIVLIAHRLSTIRGADIIYVMVDGRIAEAGVHDQLMARRGAYYTLWCAQVDGVDYIPTIVLSNDELKRLEN